MENTDQPLILSYYPRAIMHIDGDAFFASCEQSRNPALKGKPVITGKERGIAASLSYEAKEKGVRRGMRLSEIKETCPNVIMLPSDYETYSLLSKRFFTIVRRYTPDVEEYSIDECFADLTGLQRPLNMTYLQIAEKIQKDLEIELGFTFSIGLSLNKVMAKIGSKWKKPAGLTEIPGRFMHLYLQKKLINEVWGIGYQTSAFLNKWGIKTALDFAKKKEEWVKNNLIKPIYEIWQELNGKYIFKLTVEEKHNYQSIQKMKTFTPPSNNKNFIFSQLSKNIENACMKARRYKLAAKAIIIFLRTQNFMDTGYEIKLSRPTSFPNEILPAVSPIFDKIFQRNCQYRSTGAILLKLEEDKEIQLDLFTDPLKLEKLKKLYQSVDLIREKYGKHTLHLGASFFANHNPQHIKERSTPLERHQHLLKGETPRKHLNIPMFMGVVE